MKFPEMRSIVSAIIFANILLVSASFLNASLYDVEVKPELLSDEPVYSPYAGRDYPDQVLFGDTHFHTNLSPDAGLLGTRHNHGRRYNEFLYL